MKYLFSVNDSVTDHTKLYTVEAESKSDAECLFTKAFIPYLPEIDFQSLGNLLTDGMDIFIESLGPIDQIEEI